jgi:hypothetical protein
MTIEDLIQKGLIKTCDKHGAELVYYDATQDCPICKVVIQSKPINRKKIPQPVPVKTETPKVVEQKSMLDKARDWWEDKHNMKQKIFLFVVLVFLLWTYMNCSSIMSYMHG